MLKNKINPHKLLILNVFKQESELFLSKRIIWYINVSIKKIIKNVPMFIFISGKNI